MKALALALLRLYKRWVSPALPPSCRYVPTCSEYAMEAMDRYGAFRGGWMAVWRVLRCHPFVKGGYDPVKVPTHRPLRDEWGAGHPDAARTTNDQRLTTSY
jgi:putative membrane protein insertion efficiency factor